MQSLLKNFRLIRRDVDVSGILGELENQPSIWDIDTSRQDNVSIHSQTKAIVVLSHMEPASLDKEIRESFPQCFMYKGRKNSYTGDFSSTCHFARSFARGAVGVLGRVAIVNLRAHGQVTRHVDAGMYYKLRSRYHLVLKSPSGSRMVSGNEQVTLHEGELWWLNNRLPHEAYNDSDGDRIHVIFDVLSPASLIGSVRRSVLFRSRQALGMIGRNS
jgi:hypothetical protein